MSYNIIVTGLFNMNKIFLFFVLLLLLVGCKRPTEQVPTLTGTYIPITPKLFVTSTSLPTATFPPQRTKTSTHEPTSTVIALPSPTMDLVAAVVAAQPPELFSSHPSPDGMLRMDIIIYDCVKTIEDGDGNAYEQLILVDLASGEQRIADGQLQTCGGLGAYGFGGRFWSPNSRYFYYTDGRQGIPGGCGYWDSPLLRFDVASLETESLGAGSLSPDGKKVATWDSIDNVVNIWDIDDGEISHFTPLHSAAGSGPIIWSPDC